MNITIDPVHISGDDVFEACPSTTLGYGTMLAEATRYALQISSHQPGVELAIHHHSARHNAQLAWDRVNEAQTMGPYGNSRDRTEFAAEALTMLLLPLLTDHRVGIKSNIKTGFDYYIAHPPVDDVLIFNFESHPDNSKDTPVGVEITGIEKANRSNSVNKRRRQKSVNIAKAAAGSQNDILVFVAIAELSQPSFHLDFE